MCIGNACCCFCRHLSDIQRTVFIKFHQISALSLLTELDPKSNSPAATVSPSVKRAGNQLTYLTQSTNAKFSKVNIHVVHIHSEYLGHICKSNIG